MCVSFLGDWETSVGVKVDVPHAHRGATIVVEAYIGDYRGQWCRVGGARHNGRWHRYVYGCLPSHHRVHAHIGYVSGSIEGGIYGDSTILSKYMSIRCENDVSDVEQILSVVQLYTRPGTVSDLVVRLHGRYALEPRDIATYALMVNEIICVYGWTSDGCNGYGTGEFDVGRRVTIGPRRIRGPFRCTMRHEGGGRGSFGECSTHSDDHCAILAIILAANVTTRLYLRPNGVAYDNQDPPRPLGIHHNILCDIRNGSCKTNHEHPRGCPPTVGRLCQGADMLRGCVWRRCRVSHNLVLFAKFTMAFQTRLEASSLWGHVACWWVFGTLAPHEVEWDVLHAMWRIQHRVRLGFQCQTRWPTTRW